MCIYTHTHAYMQHIYTQAYIHTFIYIHTYTCLHEHKHIHIATTCGKFILALQKSEMSKFWNCSSHPKVLAYYRVGTEREGITVPHRLVVRTSQGNVGERAEPAVGI